MKKVKKKKKKKERKNASLVFVNLTFFGYIRSLCEGSLLSRFFLVVTMLYILSIFALSLSLTTLFGSSVYPLPTYLPTYLPSRPSFH